jgi:hypothetical protein
MADARRATPELQLIGIGLLFNVRMLNLVP